MNAARLDIHGVHMLQTKPDEFLLEINSTITTDGSIHADIDPFEGTVALGDVDGAKPFTTLQFPRTNADKHQTVNISQTVRITDMDAMKQFNTAFFQKEKLSVRVEGRTQVKPSGLSKKYGVDFKKTVPINGLSLFKGTQVTDGSVDITASKGTPNFKGTADIPNASLFTLDILSRPPRLARPRLVLTFAYREMPPLPHLPTSRTWASSPSTTSSSVPTPTRSTFRLSWTSSRSSALSQRSPIARMALSPSSSWAPTSKTTAISSTTSLLP